jgi:cytochrome c oxidase subunit 2
LQEQDKTKDIGSGDSAAGARRWVLGGIAALVGLGGLFLAARAGAGNMVAYYGGITVFIIAVWSIFNLVRAAYDAAEARKFGISPDEAGRSGNMVGLAVLLVGAGTVGFHFFSPWWWTPIASNWGYVDDTILVTFWITGVVFVAIVVFVAMCIYKYRYQEGRRSDYDPENKKLEWWLTGLTTVGVAGMLTPGLFVWHQFVTVPADAAELEVMAQQWRFTYRLPGEDGVLGTSNARLISFENPFGLEPGDANGRDDVLVDGEEMHLPLDKPVKVLLRSVDVLHNFYVPEFRAKMDMVPGMVTFYWFTPTRTGTFDALCFELCGVGHYAMRSRVVVDGPEAYQAWLDQQPTFAQAAAAAGLELGEPRGVPATAGNVASAE